MQLLCGRARRDEGGFSPYQKSDGASECVLCSLGLVDSAGGAMCEIDKCVSAGHAFSLHIQRCILFRNVYKGPLLRGSGNCMRARANSKSIAERHRSLHGRKLLHEICLSTRFHHTQAAHARDVETGVRCRTGRLTQSLWMPRSHLQICCVARVSPAMRIAYMDPHIPRSHSSVTHHSSVWVCGCVLGGLRVCVVCCAGDGFYGHGGCRVRGCLGVCFVCWLLSRCCPPCCLCPCNTHHSNSAVVARPIASESL